VAAGGGTLRTLTEPITKDGELGHWWPQFLPGGRTVVFTNYRVPADTSRIETYSLDTGERRTIVDRGMFGRYVASGHLLFVRSNTVFAVPFDAARLAVTGQETPILDGVATEAEAAFAHFSVSSTGTLAYIADVDFNVPTMLTWVDRKGTISPTGVESRRFSGPALSPDGRTIAAAVREKGETDIWLADVSRGVVRRLTDAPGTQMAPVWMPDGRLLYASEEPAFHIYRQSVGATGPPERLVDGPYDSVPFSALPGDEGVLYTQSNPLTSGDIWLLPFTGDRKARPIVQGRFNEGFPKVSPDGRWLAYVSDESGRSEVYAHAFPGGEDRIQVSTAGGAEPSWSADSRELFFRDSDQMMMVSVQAASPLTVTRPVKLFQMPLRNGYSVARDGRFLVVQRDPRARPTPVNIVLNWFDELRARVPVP
jgi:serine/threonine-protein kinase